MKILKSPYLVATPAIICFYCYVFFLKGWFYLSWTIIALSPIAFILLYIFLRKQKSDFNQEVEALLLELEASKAKPYSGETELQTFIERVSNLTTSDYASESDRGRLILALGNYFNVRIKREG
jgi:biopolymer transport protein ExbB/TolQ